LRYENTEDGKTVGGGINVDAGNLRTRRLREDIVKM
jgi:hypothetical protein